MARPAFTPTDAEAQAIREAEAWARQMSSFTRYEAIASDPCESKHISQAKGAATALDTALRELLGDPNDGDRYEGQAQRLMAALQASDGAQWALKPKDEVFLQLQRLQKELRALLWALHEVAPGVGAPQHPSRRAFIMRAADNWLQATGQAPTAGGRFLKCIGAVAADYSGLTEKSLQAALNEWYQLRGILTP